MWRKRDEVLDRETLDGVIRKLMDIDTKLAAILEHLGLMDDEADEDDT